MTQGYATFSEFEPFAEERAGGLSRLTLMVEGVHCAACIQKIESALAKDPDVETARLNFSTKRLTIEWRGSVQQADKMAEIVKEQGYKVQPYDPKAVQAESDEEERFLQICLGVSAFAAFNTMLIAEALWFSAAEMGQGTRDLLHWVSALIAIPAVMYTGQPFFRVAWAALKKGKANMDVPISLGVIGPVARTCTTGTANPKAHGQVIIRTVTAIRTESATSTWPRIHHPKNVAAARVCTTGVYNFATRSAKRTYFACPCSAFSMSRTISDRRESLLAAVTDNFIGAAKLIVPA